MTVPERDGAGSGPSDVAAPRGKLGPMEAGNPPRKGLWVLALVFLAVYAPTLVWLQQRWSMGVWHHVHGYVVLPIAALLAWREARTWKGVPSDPSRLGFLLLGVAVVLQIADTALRFDALSAVSLLVAVPGLCLLVVGRERTRQLWFPLLFLWFALPIPLVIARKVHLALRNIAAVATERSLDVMGYDVVREGTLLTIGSERVQVADACSGFNTLMALTMAGMLLAYLAGARLGRTILVLLLVFPAAIVANILRCVVLSMLVAAFGPDILSTFAHDASGFATFALALLLLLASERWLLPRRAEAAAR